MLCHAVSNAHVAIDNSAVGIWCHILFYASVDFFNNNELLTYTSHLWWRWPVYELTALFCHSMLEKIESYFVKILILRSTKW